jgi:transposase InsO family protein
VNKPVRFVLTDPRSHVMPAERSASGLRCSGRPGDARHGASADRGGVDNGACFRGEVFKTAFDKRDPPLRHVRTRVRSPKTNGVIERWFGTLKYEHLFRGVIIDGDAWTRRSTDSALFTT